MADHFPLFGAWGGRKGKLHDRTTHYAQEVALSAADIAAINRSGVLAAGTALIGKFGIDQATANANEVVTKTGSITTASSPTSVASFTTQVSAASVADAAASVIDATATGGKRYARIRVSANQSHEVRCYGADVDFALIANGYILPDATRTGLVTTAGTLGESWVVDCSGYAFFAVEVTNKSGGAAATVTAAVAYSD